MPFWERLAVVGAVVVASALVAKLVDSRLARRPRGAGAETRYRVLRRSVMTVIVVLGLLSALLIIPQVRAVAGGLLASSAVVTIVAGFAAQRTLGNFVAGLLIAFAQPIRLGDRVGFDGVEGVVEEITLTYTVIRADDNTRLVVPNERLASDTIRNSTIVSREALAQITVQVPLDTDLQHVVDLVRQHGDGTPGPEAFVSGLDAAATVTVRAWAPSEAAAQQLEGDLRLRVHAVLRENGIWAPA